MKWMTLKRKSSENISRYGKVDPQAEGFRNEDQRARTMAYLLKSHAELVKTTELEERIEILEKRAEELQE